MLGGEWSFLDLSGGIAILLSLRLIVSKYLLTKFRDKSIKLRFVDVLYKDGNKPDLVASLNQHLLMGFLLCSFRRFKRVTI